MGRPLRLYLDQMISSQASKELVKDGHDVLRASETGQERADDEKVLERAVSEGRILVTLDAHFGDWVVLPLRHHSGVIRLKVNPSTANNIVDLLTPFLRLHSQAEFIDHMVILSGKRAKWIQTA